MAINSEHLSIKHLLSTNPEEVNRAVMQLYEQYYPGVSSYLLKRGLNDMDIQDVFQDGILAFLRALREGKINEKANVGGYLFTICKHIGIKKGEKNSRTAGDLLEAQALEKMPADWEPTEEEEERNALRMRSWKIMESLGNPCAELLKKAFGENRKIVDFFAELGYKNAQVARTAKYKCLQRLKAKLEKDPRAQQLIKILFS